MKIGSQVEGGDLQVPQPREGLQSTFTSCWTEWKSCKCFPNRKVSATVWIFLCAIPRDMAKPWETH